MINDVTEGVSGEPVMAILHGRNSVTALLSERVVQQEA